MNSPPPSLLLYALNRTESGESIEPFSLQGEGPITIGRSSDADWPIADSSVSRRHAQITRKGEQWFIADLQSRHGTSINGKQLEPGQRVRLAHGDDIGLGTWRCRCRAAGHAPAFTTAFVDAPVARASISAIDPSKLSGVAQRGLESLLHLSAALDGAKTIHEASAAAISAVQSATACRRVVVVRSASENDLEVLASTVDDQPRVSRSLIDAATRQGLVELVVAGQNADQAQSIMELRIRSAICAPILAGGSPAAFLMLDTRDDEGTLPADAAAFCLSVARLTGLAIEHIGAAALAERHLQLQQDLEAARRAQELLSPAPKGVHGAVRYVFESIPGRFVAGDLFDFFPLDDDRAAFFLGDVSGKGVGAAMLMAAAQSQLRTQLLSRADLTAAIAAVSADLHRRSEASKFVTLVAGVIDAKRGMLRIVDAGHGFGALVPSGGTPVRIQATPGFPLGVVEDADYEAHEAAFPPGSRLVLFSDGAVEQPDPQGRQFGLEATLASIAKAISPESAVTQLVADVRAHAAGPLADDLTVASVWLE